MMFYVISIWFICPANPLAPWPKGSACWRTPMFCYIWICCRNCCLVSDWAPLFYPQPLPCLLSFDGRVTTYLFWIFSSEESA